MRLRSGPVSSGFLLLWQVTGMICAGPSSTSGTTECFNPATTAWELQSFQSPQPTGWRAAIDLGDVVCLAGGVIGSTASALVHCLNYSNPAWYPAPNLNAARRAPTPIYGPGGWIGIAGGATSWEQSPQGQQRPLSWTLLPTSNFAIDDYPLTFSYNGTISAVNWMGGVILRNNTPTTWSWITGPGWTPPRVSPALLIHPITGYPCAVGGDASIPIVAQNSFTNSVICITPGANNSWSWPVVSFSPPPSYPLSLIAARNLTLGGLPCVAGGNDNSGTSQAAVYCLNYTTPTTGSWVAFPSLLMPRTGFTTFRYPQAFPTPAPTPYPTSSPTTSPTTSPTSPMQYPTQAPIVPTTSPTSAPSNFPSAAPSKAPTTSAPTQPSNAWWDVNYLLIFTASSWSTFTILLPPPGSRPNVSDLSAMAWTFSSAPTTISKGLTLNFPPYTFTAGQTYTFTTKLGSALSQAYSFSIAISPLTVTVIGGNNSVLANSSLSLDASQSFDPDLPQPAAFYSLNFSWTNLTCRYASISGPTNTAQLQLHLGRVETCAITVTVASKSSGKAPQQQAVTMEVLDYVVSTVTISGPGEVCTSDTLRLLATVTNTPASQPLTSYSWTVSPALPFTTANCALPSSASPNNRALSLTGACFAAGTTYLFSFVASNGKDAARAWHTVETFGIPSGGSCVITPASGTTLDTQFTVFCSGWAQAAPVVISLTYSLSIISSDGTERGITFPQSSARIQTMLPILSIGDHLNVRITGYGGASTLFQLPLVTIAQGSSCPLPGSGTLQDLITIFSSAQIHLCSPPVIAAGWNSLWQQLQAQRIALEGGNPSEAALSWYLTGLEAAVPNAPVTATAQPSYQTEVLDILQFFADAVETPALATGVLTLSTAMLPVLKSNCTAVDIATVLLAQLVRTSTAGGLPSDPTYSVDLQGAGVTSDYYFGDSQDQLQASNGVVVSLPSSLVQQGGAVSSVTVSSFGGFLYNPACRAGKNSEIQVGSGIVDITLSSRDGSLVSVTSVSGGFSFLLPVDPNAQCGAALECGWWDSKVLDWVTTGCHGGPTSDRSVYRCTCTHLTEFALLLRPAQCGQLRAAFLVLLAMFCILAVFTAGKIALRIKLGAKGMTTLLWQHSMIFALCILRALGCASLGSSLGYTWDLAARAAVLVLPYMLMFWIYTLMATQWAALFHFGLKYKNEAFSKVRWIFLLCNILVCIAVLTLLSTFSSAINDDQREQIASVASATLAAVVFITGLVFIVYASLIYKFITQSGRGSTRGSIVPERCHLSLQGKILTGAVIVSVLLCLEAVMHAVSLSTTNVTWQNQSEVIVLLVDWLNLCVLLTMYHKAMIENKKTTKTSQPTHPLRTHESHLRSHDSNIQLKSQDSNTQLTNN